MPPILAVGISSNCRFYGGSWCLRVGTTGSTMLVTVLSPRAGRDLHDRSRKECDGAKTALSQRVEASQVSVLVQWCWGSEIAEHFCRETPRLNGTTTATEGIEPQCSAVY